MELFVRPKKTRFCWLKALPAGLSLLLLGHVAAAQNLDTFDVGSGVPADNNTEPLVDYTTPINATNFFNDTGSTFSFNVAPSTYSWLQALYQGWHYTRNFTNYGEMDSSTGFRFDTQLSTSHVPAGNFYNSGLINCGSFSGAIFLNQFLFSGVITYGGYGGAYVLATNIFNSGTIDVGPNGLATFKGDRIDFSRGTVTIESQLQGSLFGFSTPTLTATGQTDYNTNDWFPATALNAFSANAPLNSLPFQFYVFNSAPYFDIRTTDATGTNVVVRMIFLQDNSVNVTTNIYISPNNLFSGEGTVEWVGTYTDPATGQTASRYLYLNDNYLAGSSTNILKYGNPGTGVPGNFTFVASDTQLALGTPTTSGFVSGLFSADDITNNIYSYFSGQIVPTSVSTNTSYGPISITNLPGRVEINAAKELNLSLASISGMNYVLLKSTNQFNTDGSSQIPAPYSDIYLGNTNGTMVITNLIQASIPRWNGTVSAYSTCWTNSFQGTNYDFRVLLVASQLNPASGAQVQDFVLYSSNNVVISDQLNITRTLSLNCTNLLITTNGLGTGASSLEGALNLNSTGISWAGSVPRLRCLTNNGAINTLNLATYGSVAAPYLSLFNAGVIYNYGGATIYSRNFENYGLFSAGTGSFSVQSLTTTMTNGMVTTAGTFSDTASNLVISGTSIQAGKSLTLVATNLLTDISVTNGNVWVVGTNYPGYGTWTGLVLPIKPAYGDLLGTTITNVAVAGTLLNNTWAGQDRGYSAAGFSNNAAIGQLVLDAQGPAPHSGFYFTGTGTNNAIYVDRLVLLDYASYTNRNGVNLPTLLFNTNLVIYYAQAVTGDGISVADKINGFNTNHLRWVSSYAGHFSSTNLVYPNGTTNAVNAALTQLTFDSDGDGILNPVDPTPVFVPSQVQFTVALTNSQVKVQWTTIPRATNYIDYTTNLASPSWQPFTNFSNYYYGANVAVANLANTNYFVSPQSYPGPATNVWIYDAVTNVPHFYRVMVMPIYP